MQLHMFSVCLSKEYDFALDDLNLSVLLSDSGNLTLSDRRSNTILIIIIILIIKWLPCQDWTYTRMYNQRKRGFITCHAAARLASPRRQIDIKVDWQALSAQNLQLSRCMQYKYDIKTGNLTRDRP